MARYHISEKTDRPNICRAKPGNCPLNSGDVEAPHFGSEEGALTYVEEKNAQKYGEVGESVKKDQSETHKTDSDSPVKSVDKYGTIRWEKDGRFHREDGPAIEYADGTKEWCKNGKLHREDGPAIERYDGTKAWYRNGRLHRNDGPAVEFPDGSKEWWIKGKPVS